MAVRLEVHPLPPFDPTSDPTSVDQRWKTWSKRFETYLVALNITEDKQKRALLLYQAGQATQEIFETLQDTGDTYEAAKTKLDSHFAPKKNVDYEIFQFRQAAQKPGETVDQFSTRLRKLAATCEFHDSEKEIKSAIILNCLSKRLRRFALREENLTLDQLLSKARSLEASEQQASGMEQSLQQTTEAVNNLHLKRKSQPSKPRKWTKPQQKPPHASQASQCRQCGRAWPHTQGPCPAKGKMCNKCGKPNHFSNVCYTNKQSRQMPAKHSSPQGSQARTQMGATKIHMMTTHDSSESESDDEYVFTISALPGSSVPTADVEINGCKVKVLIDTGASADVIDETAFAIIQGQQQTHLQQDGSKIFAYGAQTKLEVIGKFDATVCANDKKTSSTFHVLKGNHGSLLSYGTAHALGLVNIEVNKIATAPVEPHLKQQYPNVFNGIGKMKNFEVKLHIDEGVTPVAQPARRIPFHLRKKVSQELKRLEQEDIIEKVEGPTPWVSPLIAIPKKNGDVRLCVDMRLPNAAIQRERHPTPTIDDLVDTLNGATVFSKLDLRSGYHQLLLAPESRYITTFATHEGLRRYTRLNFGTTSASEIFQNAIHEQIRDIRGSLNISDDIIIFGKTQQEHDEALHAVLQRFNSVGLTLREDKCELNKKSITFFGFVFSGKGVSPDPEKVKAIHDAQPPSSASEVRSFLGMATYCAKFIPKFSDVTKPLRDLTKKSVPFHWDEEHQQAFKTVKDLLTSETVMAYFDQAKETHLTTDASPWGLSAILSQKAPGQQECRIVAYVSRSLTSVEQRYSQTEKEALAIIWATERLHTYLCGGHFVLHTDCKPVEMILNNKKSRPPARIERWNLRLQEYSFTTVHTKGVDNPSDFLSRHPSKDSSHQFADIAEAYVNFITTHSLPKAISLADIQKATENDPILQKLMEMICNNNWKQKDTDNTLSNEEKAELNQFIKVKEELTLAKNVILRGTRIVVPKSLRDRTLALAHQGHQGIVKTKQLLREKVWFPQIDNQVTALVSNCIACQANGPNVQPTQLQMTPLPPSPWHTLNVDFCGPFPTGEYLFVAIDAYSRFPEVEIVHSTSATSTITKLERIFATHGIPSVIKSDNGPPFTSQEFQDFVEEMGIRHARVTPLWPQANAEAENFMKPITKAVRSAHIENKDWKRELFKFLMNYRVTPHSTTKIAPAELLFNRKVHVKLPQIETPSDPQKDSLIRQRDEEAKAKMKNYADTKRRAVTELKVEVGNKVLLRQRKKNKFTSKFDPNPFDVIRVKGTMVTARRNGKFVTRNVSFFKSIQNGNTDDSAYEDDDIENQTVVTNSSGRRYPVRNRVAIQRYGQNIYDT